VVRVPAIVPSTGVAFGRRSAPRLARRPWLGVVSVAALGSLFVSACTSTPAPTIGPITQGTAPATSTPVVGPTTTGTVPASTSMSTTSTASTTTSTTTTSTPMDNIYDPYAGTLAGVPAIGQVSDGTLRTADGRTRRYRLYVPSSLAAGDLAPLLVALHGGLGSSAQFAANSGFDELAEANGFIVVYPDGIGARPDGSGPQTWNGGYCCGPAVRQDVDDVGFIRLLLDTLAAGLPIDPVRVFAAGHSNGAILAYRLACELSDRIVGIGVQAGSLGVDACTPRQPVSVIHLHGTADTNHPIDGGKGSGVAGVEFRPARAAVEALAAADGCADEPRSSTDPANPDLAVATWSGCGSGAEVRYVEVDGATHAWMGHPPASAAAAAYVGEPYPNLDASRAIWSFLAAHPRA
jgi:polyhydroxybutyrate depolymerase